MILDVTALARALPNVSGMSFGRLLSRGAMALGAVLLLPSCMGLVEGGNDSRGSGPGSVNGPLVCTDETIAVGPTPFRRLTRLQYENTVRDLLGLAGAPVPDLPADDRTEGFEVGATVSPLHVERYADAAEALASLATEDLGTLLPCDPSEVGEETCAGAFIRDFGARAFRRPLGGKEIERLEGVFRAGSEAADFRTGVELVIQTALQSPSFLYHVEGDGEVIQGTPLARIDAYALASRLSYFLWTTMPDDQLFAAAASGELDTIEGLDREVRRLLEDPRSERGIRSFFRQWLDLDRVDGIEKHSELHPEFDGVIARALRRSLEAFLDAVVGNGGTLDDLLLESYAFVSPEIAPYFGVEVASTGMSRVELEPARRPGILGHPALLALHAKPNQSDPIHRGTFVRERLLCQHLPPPPADLVVVAPDPAPGLSTRERFQEHSTNPACKGCHELVDPIGFGFEHFDEVGRWRDTDDGRPVDASGEIVSTKDANGSFYGVTELASRLAMSRDVQECFVRQVFRFALQRVEMNDDQCTLDDLHTRFSSSGKDIRELLADIVTSPAFRYRVVPAVEGGSL